MSRTESGYDAGGLDGKGEREIRRAPIGAVEPQGGRDEADIFGISGFGSGADGFRAGLGQGQAGEVAPAPGVGDREARRARRGDVRRVSGVQG